MFYEPLVEWGGFFLDYLSVIYQARKVDGSTYFAVVIFVVFHVGAGVEGAAPSRPFILQNPMPEGKGQL